MITPVLSIVLFAASATAQITTSIWAYQGFIKTDKYGYYGSVVAVDGVHTTLALTYDNGTDLDALGFSSSPETYVVGPAYWEGSATNRFADHRTESGDIKSDDNVQKFWCEKKTTSGATPSCTASYGRVFAVGLICNEPNTYQTKPSTIYHTRTNTYSGRGTYSAGVETITDILTIPVDTRTPPDWCNEDTYPATFTGFVTTLGVPESEFASIQVVITAGQEKLSATAGASATPTNVQPTSSQSTSTRSALATFTGAAVPMRPIATAVAGLGVAIAAFVY